MRALLSFCLVIFAFINAGATPIQTLRDISTIYKVPVGQDTALRVTYTAAKAPTKKVIIFLPGRASYFEKNRGLVLALTGHSYKASFGKPLMNQADFWCVDPRAQGGSNGRLAPNDQRGHIDDFETYLHDIHIVIKDKIAPSYKGQNVEFYLMGSSLGGHLALRYLQGFSAKMPITLQKSLFVVPMVEMNTAPWPVLVAKGLAYGAVKMGKSQTYAIGYGDMKLDKPDFSKFTGHHNEKAFDQTNALMLADLSLVTGGPTYGWVAAAFDSQDKLLTSPLLKKHKIVFFLAGNDKAVLTSTSQDFAKQHGITTYIYNDSYHNILKESAAYAGSFWQDLDQELN